MKGIDGTITFCPKCPIAGKAKGELIVNSTETRSRFDGRVTARTLTLTGENGGISRTINGSPDYTVLGDVDRLGSAIEGCTSPQTEVSKERTAIWPFGRVTDVEHIACQALKTFYSNR